MLQIRRGVFETNSSSSHSLVIKKDGEQYTHDEIMESFGWRLGCYGHEGIWRPWSGELHFGRSPFQILTGFPEKLAYAYACTRMENWDEVTAVVHEILPEYLGIDFDNKYNFAGTDDMALYGWLKKAGVGLKDFLLDKRYVVICDGDEYCTWIELKNAGLIDFDVIDSEIG